MTHEEEMALTRELGDLMSAYSLIDKSEENRKRGERIREIKELLGIAPKNIKTDRRPPRYRSR